MATSTQDLIDAIVGLTATRTPDVAQADSAITALQHLGRALDGLSTGYADTETAAQARRRVVVHELASACLHCGTQWLTVSGRLPDLAGAAADLLGRHGPGLDAQQRWAIAIALTDAVTRCAEIASRFAPYADVPALRGVLRSAALREQLARLDPPDPSAGALLDHAVAGPEYVRGDQPTSRAMNAAAALVLALDREWRAGTLDIYAVLAACAAAETSARVAVAVVPALNGARQVDGVAGQAPDGWQVLQAALIRFDDGSRRLPPSSAVTDHALRLHEAVSALPGITSDDETVRGQVATTTRFMVNHLPAIAQQVERSIGRWARTGALFAQARTLPRSTLHLNALLRDEAVVVTPRDIGPVLQAARAAAGLSAALAVELDRTAGAIGRQPQPHQLAALTASVRVEQLARDAQRARLLVTRADLIRSITPTASNRESHRGGARRRCDTEPSRLGR